MFLLLIILQITVVLGRAVKKGRGGGDGTGRKGRRGFGFCVCKIRMCALLSFYEGSAFTSIINTFVAYVRWTVLWRFYFIFITVLFRLCGTFM